MKKLKNWNVKKTPWYKDMDKKFEYKGEMVNLGVYNLIITCTTLELYNNDKLESTKNFKLKDVYKYFGLDGYGLNKHTLLSELKNFRNQLN
jgi:hypothetical protein